MNWLKKIHQALVRDIAVETVRTLESRRGWQEFLPPVAFRDCVYMFTKDGAIYRMHQDSTTGMEIITQISVHLGR